MVSVLIVNWNTRELLRACLASLQKYPPSSPFELIVVDNDSTDGSAEMVRSEFPDVHLLLPHANTGYAKGNNIAFQAAQGEWLLTLNPDTEVEEGVLDKAIETLLRNPAYGALGVKQIGPDGETQRSIRGFPTVLGIFGDISGLGKSLPGSRWDSYRMTGFDYEKEQPGPQPMGTFLLFRRDALQAVGDPACPFDEDFPIFFNEVDLLYRMAKKGLPCLYTPNARILHHHGQGTRQVKKSMIWESHKSLVRFLLKHAAGPLDRFGIRLLGVIIYAAAFVRARGYSAGFRA